MYLSNIKINILTKQQQQQKLQISYMFIIEKNNEINSKQLIVNKTIFLFIIALTN